MFTREKSHAGGEAALGQQLHKNKVSSREKTPSTLQVFVSIPHQKRTFPLVLSGLETHA